MTYDVFGGSLHLAVSICLLPCVVGGGTLNLALSVYLLPCVVDKWEWLMLWCVRCLLVTDCSYYSERCLCLFSSSSFISLCDKFHNTFVNLTFVSLLYGHDGITSVVHVRSMSSPVRPSARPSVCRLSVTFVHPTQAIEIFGNVSTPFGTLAIPDLSIKIFQRSFQGNPFVGG